MSRGDDRKKPAELVRGANQGREEPRTSMAGCMLIALGGMLLWIPVLAFKMGRRVLQVIGGGPRGSLHGLPVVESAHRISKTAECTASADCAGGSTSEPRARDHAALDADRRPGTSGSVSVVLAEFCIAILAGLAFLFAFWTNQSNAILGTTLAIFLGGMGVTFVSWSHRLVIQYEVVEDREPLVPARPDRETLAEDFESSKDQIARRGILKFMCAAAAAMAGFIGVSFLRSLGPSPESELYSTIWKRGQRLVGLNGMPVSIHSLRPGSTMVVFPEGNVGDKRAQTVLIRVLPELLQLPPERAQWAPSGVLAYSRVCTHAGCAAGVYETTAHLLMCPCHQSTFDVLRAATPTSGPAARPLPQLPLYADAEGWLHAGGGFSEPPGPEFWGIT